MSINTFMPPEDRQKMSAELDKQVVQASTVGFFEDNVLRAKFVGAKTVLIPELDMSGLGHYDRDNGFVTGAISITSEPFTLKQDRARTFQLDREDNDESGIADLAGEVLSEFVRTKVAPEMDAYCLSLLGGYANSHGQSIDHGLSPYAAFAEAVNQVRDEVGYDEELVCFADGAFLKGLTSSNEINRQIVVNDFKKGEIDLRVRMIDDVALLPVPSTRMKTQYTFFDGTTSGQKEGGFEPTAAAENIRFIVLPKRAVSLVKKSETLRVFTPEQNQKADAYKFDYRLYYDVFIKNSMKKGIYALVEANS